MVAFMCVYSIIMLIATLRVLDVPVGLGASLAKDIPFAALYWSMLEPTRTAMLQQLENRASVPSVDGSANLAAPARRSPTELLAVNITSAGAVERCRYCRIHSLSCMGWLFAPWQTFVSL